MDSKIDIRVAKSNSIQSIYKLAEACSKRNAMLCICGEKGVGKETLARYIHSQSAHKHTDPILYSPSDDAEQSKQQFLKIIQNLAKQQTSIIIYDILDASIEIQQLFYAMIPRFQGRLLILTQGNCEEAYESGKLLSELYYRLQLLSVFIPPLRERPEDILDYARIFQEEITRHHFLPNMHLSPDAEQYLLEYAWPGNLDELRCVLERAALYCKETIKKEDLHLKLQGTGLDIYKDDTLKVAVHAFKRKLLTERLAQNNWNQTISARTLGIQRTYLIKLIKELSISKEYAR